jgi:chemotaxis family two-component system sensor kinase Cph1
VSLYADFTLDRESCSREPIHRPQAIQGSGHLLAIDAQDHHRLLAHSDGALDALGLPADLDSASMWDDAGSRLPEPVVGLVSEVLAGDPDATATGTLTAHSRTWELIGHRHDGVVIVELEQGDPSALDHRSLAGLTRLLERLGDREALYAQVPGEVRRLLGYDRVMLYQFDPEGHGSVVGEAKRNDLEPYLGLRYPATDIPPMARRLFLIGGTRTIPEVGLANRDLVFRPDRGPGDHLDLGRSHLRATSPIHVEYLINMGVGASLTIPIIIRGGLWGLVACHHYEPKNPCHADRQAADVIGAVLARRLLEIELAESAETAQLSASAEETFTEAIRIEDQYRLRFLREPDLLLSLCPCDGAAVIVEGTAVLSAGPTPTDDVMEQLVGLLAKQFDQPVIVTESVQQTLPESEDVGLVGGLVAVRVSEVNDSYLFWFREPVSQSVHWAGDPGQDTLTEHLDAAGNIRLGPRASFARWNQVIDDRCLPWPTWTTDMAHRIRQRVLRMELEHTAQVVERSNREFFQLTYAASHDLREPLRNQLNYLELLGELLDDPEPDVAFTLDRIATAVGRMQDLVDDLLHYADVSQVQQRELVDLNVVLDEVIEDLRASIEASEAEVVVGPLPTLVGDVQHFRQLFQNLVSNGLKYVAPGVAPRVSVTAEVTGDTVTLRVSDNGIGVAPEYHERIFQLFARLHRKDQYAGTGIGLAIAKRVVEHLDGVLGVESALGEGSTFWARFHHLAPAGEGRST